MRKTVSMLLVVVAAASTVSLHEAAAQSRGDKGGRTGGGSITHGGDCLHAQLIHVLRGLRCSCS